MVAVAQYSNIAPIPDMPAGRRAPGTFSRACPDIMSCYPTQSDLTQANIVVLNGLSCPFLETQNYTNLTDQNRLITDQLHFESNLD